MHRQVSRVDTDAFLVAMERCVREETGLTCSIGVACNKRLARIAWFLYQASHGIEGRRW